MGTIDSHKLCWLQRSRREQHSTRHLVSTLPQPLQRCLSRVAQPSAILVFMKEYCGNYASIKTIPTTVEEIHHKDAFCIHTIL